MKGYLQFDKFLHIWEHTYENFLAHNKLGEEGSQTVKPFFLGLILARGELLAIVQTFPERVFFKEN